MASDGLKREIARFKQFEEKHKVDDELIDAYLKAAQVAYLTEKDHRYGLNVTKHVKDLIHKHCLASTEQQFGEAKELWQLERLAQDKQTSVKLVDMFYRACLLESYDRFESYIYYLEKDRYYSKRFYQPRRKSLGIVVDDLQALEDGTEGFTNYCLSLPSRVGKSTLCIMFLSWVMAKRPNDHNAMGGHSGVLAKGFYKEMLNFITTSEYRYADIYELWHPGHVLLREKDSETFKIILDKPDRFASLTCRGIDGTWTGDVDISGYLYVDDIVRNREHALNPVRMEDTYNTYLNTMLDRMVGGAKQLMVGTLWNIYDPIERLRRKYEDNPEYRFRRIPALNEKDESNFDYEFNGFSTKYYHDMRERLDIADWMAKYQQQPLVREGLLFDKKELRYFEGTLPEEGDRRFIASIDPAFGGGDFVSMPICCDMGKRRRFIIAWVFDNSSVAKTVSRVVKAIRDYYITEVEIEGNAGGKMYAKEVSDELKKQEIKFCKISTPFASTRLGKVDKINGFSDHIKEDFLFLMPNGMTENVDRVYYRDRDYDLALNNLTTYTSEGKNAHDDAPDSLVQLSDMTGKNENSGVMIIDRASLGF